MSAASYEARAYGVRSAMPLRTAARLCPAGVFLPVDGKKYAAVSRQVMGVLRRYTPRVEQLSIDEAFLDVEGSEALFGPAERIAERLKSDVRAELGLTVSVGVATTKLVAKIASDLRKPDGLVVVPAGTETAFLAPLPIERLWGVGPATRRILAEYDVRTIGDLAALPEDLLLRRFGRHGPELVARARGVDPSPVADPGEAKSVSQEHTFATDTDDRDRIETTLLALADGVSGRLRAGGVKARTIAVKIRDSAFVTITRQRSLAAATDETEEIWRVALALAAPELRGVRVRLLGIAASHLDDREQLTLFSPPPERRRRAAAAADAIRKRFGRHALVRARLLEEGVPAPFERDHTTAPEAARVGRDAREPGDEAGRARSGDGA